MNGLISSDFLDWEQQDQLLSSCLLSSISKDLLSHFVGCENSFEIWRKVDLLYSANSQNNILQYKAELSNLKKAGLSMNEYLLKVKTLVDNLRYSGYVLGPNDHVLYILGGFGSEFDLFVMTVNAKAGKA